MRSLLIVAASSALLAAAPPFPAPKLIPVTDPLKCDWGPIASVTDRELVLHTEPGPLTLQIGPQTKVARADGSPGVVSTLTAGTKVRVYYFVDNGARLQEVDVVP